VNEICLAAATELLGHPSARFNPYLLFRRGMLPLSELKSLVPAGTWELLDKSEKLSVGRKAWAVSLADHLSRVVPALDPGDRQLRKLVLQLRRDIHNDRIPEEAAIAEVKCCMDDAAQALLEQWQGSRLAGEALQTAAQARLADELKAARSSLAKLAANEYLLKGIQLSGDNLYRDVRSYIGHFRDADARPWTKKLRQTESTIIRYAYRMALRTSPFGTFTEIGAQPWRSPAGPVLAGLTERRSLIRLSRNLLVWMALALRRIEGSNDLFQLRLNNTLQVLENHIEGFTRGIEGGSHAYWGEGFINVRIIGPVVALVDALAEGPCSRTEVQDHLVARGMPADRALTFLNRLVEAGLCHEGLGLPDQATSYVDEVVARLRKIDAPKMAECAKSFATLQHLEERFGVASTREREQLLEDLRQEVGRFSQICDIESPVEAGRTLVFEDMAAVEPARSWDPDLVERNTENFSRFLRFLPVFHPSTMERLGLHRWFVSRFGEEGRCEDLITLYRLFSEQSEEEVSAVLQAKNDPEAERVRELQQHLLQRLDQQVAHCGNAPVLRLNEDCLDEITASLPDFLPSWTEASFRLQIAPGDAEGSPLLVINDVSSGHGVFFSRFCDVVEPVGPDAWSLRRALSETIARNSPDQADLIAVFGHNVNLHPRLTPKEVVYPGSVAGGTDALTLRDIAVECDSSQRTLRLVDRRDGKPLQLTPMNFLFPAAAPMLYRFLCAFSPLHTYRIGFWNSLRRWARRRFSCLPRLVLGDLVVERRRWYVPVSEVAQLGDGSTAETLGSMLATENWYRQRNLPRECFFQIYEQPAAGENAAVTRDWVDETRRWALSSRNARRKGQYLDFRNPFLVRLLARQASSMNGGEVLFQECLPPTSSYDGSETAASAEEFLIELRSRSIQRDRQEAL
jgi:Lantibiotic dehydratase, N terminus